jgi:hypothetical protein
MQGRDEGDWNEYEYRTNSSGGTGMSSMNIGSNKSFNEHGHWE